MQRPFDGSCTELRIVSFFGDVVDRIVRDAQVDTLLLQHLVDAAHLQPDNRFDVLFAQFAEVDDLVDTVDELRPNGRTQLLFGEVRGHDDERVLEVDHTSFVIRQTTVVQHLQQHVEHIRVGFLDLVEQHDRVGFPTNRFRQLTALIVTDVSRRRTDQSRRAELLLVLAHVDTRHHVLVVEQVVRQRFRQLGLTHTRRTEEDETADRSFGVLQAGTRTTNRITHGYDRLVLTNHPLVQLFLEMQQLVALGLHHLSNRYTGPTSYYLSDIVFIDFLFDKRLVADGVERILRSLDIRFCRRDLAVANLRYLTVVTFAFGHFGLMLQTLNARFLVLDSGYVAFLLVPPRIELITLFLEF